MRHATVDASVVFKWFKHENEPHRGEAERVRREFERGDLVLLAPSFLGLELINTLGRRWAWPPGDLRDATIAFLGMGVSLDEPDLISVATWVERGLSAYDAAYLAVAERRAIPLVTADERVIAASDGIAVHVTRFAA